MTNLQNKHIFVVEDNIGNLTITKALLESHGAVVAQSSQPVSIDDQNWDTVACFTESLRISTEAGMEGERAQTLRDTNWNRQIRGVVKACGRKRGRFSSNWARIWRQNGWQFCPASYKLIQFVKIPS